MWEMVIGDLEVTHRQLCCCHSFIFTANVSFILEVRVTGPLGGNCVVVIHLF